MTGMRNRRVAAAGLLTTAALAVGGTAVAARSDVWKGAESFTQTALTPNVERCGAAPGNLEGSFAGSGIDTAQGTFAVTTSGCVNVETLRVSDLRATDTYLRSGDSVRIVADDFTLVLDPDTCVATNRRSVRFRVAGGTGELAGARGRGRFDIAMNWTPCNGLSLPAHVWFEGRLEGAG